MKETIGIFSKLGMGGGSENRVVQLANSFSDKLVTFIFAERDLNSNLKKQLKPNVILREFATKDKKAQYELSGLDHLLIVNSDSYSFCKPSYWDGTQGKHHTNNIDISQIGDISVLFNYVVSPAQWLVDMHKINPRIKIMATSDWFIKNLNTESKFEKLRTIDLPMMQVNSPVSLDYAQDKAPSDKIRINRHSMAFAYKHDQDNLKIVDTLCKKYGDKISFHWVGVPSQVRNVKGKSKDDKTPYRSVLEKHKQMKVSKEYSVKIPKLLSETDIMLFYISRYRKEPWPRTIAEAMMAGCCCVSNNNYGMAEQIKSGETGYLFNDTDQCIEQLCDLIDNPEKIKALGNAAQEHAKQNFLDDVITSKMISFMGD